MNAAEILAPAVAPVQDEAMEANGQELKALWQFASGDETRPHMSCVWMYRSEGGRTYMATDGHTMIVRRSGTHRTMALADIAKMTAYACGAYSADRNMPPPWHQVLKAPNCEGKNIAQRGMNPAYFGRVAAVENSAGRRDAADYVPRYGTSLRDQKRDKECLKGCACAKWSIGCDVYDGWYFDVDSKAARWEGVLMPRRV